MNIGKLIFRLKKNVPLLLTIGTTIGIAATSYFSAKAALEVNKILNETPDEELKSFPTKKKILFAVLPPFIACSGTIACNIGTYVNCKKIKAGFLSAYGILNTAYQATLLKMPVEQEIQMRNDIDAEYFKSEIPAIQDKCPGDDYILWRDDYRKKPFWAREADILKAKDQLNRDLLNPNFSRHWGTAGLNDFYEHVIGEKEPQDDLWGWDIDYMLEQWDCGFLELDWYVCDPYTDENGNVIPCRHIYWWCEPMLDYQNYKSEYE